MTSLLLWILRPSLIMHRSHDQLIERVYWWVTTGKSCCHNLKFKLGSKKSRKFERVVVFESWSIRPFPESIITGNKWEISFTSQQGAKESHFYSTPDWKNITEISRTPTKTKVQINLLREFFLRHLNLHRELSHGRSWIGNVFALQFNVVNKASLIPPVLKGSVG